MSFLNGLYQSTDIQLNGADSQNATYGDTQFYLISSLGENFVIYVDGTSVFVLNSSTGVLTISSPINITSTFSVGGVPTTPVYLRGYFSNNLACGSNSLTSANTGKNNVGIGINSLTNTTGGEGNVGIGLNALLNQDIGTANVAVGINAGYAITTGSENVMIGSNAGNSSYNCDNCTLIGASSHLTGVWSYSTAIGYNSYISASSQISLGSGSENIIMRGNTDLTGGTATATTQATSDNSTKVATTAFVKNQGYVITSSSNTWTGATNDFTGSVITATTQAENDNTTKVATTAFVSRLLYHDNLNNFGINTTHYTNAPPSGGGNFAIGNNVLQKLTTGGYNTAVGNNSLRDCTSGAENFCLGSLSMYALTTGSFNVAVGVFTLPNTNGNGNVGIGRYVGGGSSGDNNVYIGYFAAVSVGADGNNVGIGSYVYPNIGAATNNVAVGGSAGSGLTTGTFNTFLGTSSSVSSGTLTYATAIGAGSQATTSNQISLGRSSDVTYTNGGLVIPSGKTLTYNGSTLSGSIVDTGTANQSITARKDFNGFDNTIPNYCGSSFVSPVFRPRLFTLFDSINNSCHALGSNSARNLQVDATNTAVYSLGQDCLSAKTLNTKNVTAIGGNSMPLFSSETFNFVTALGQGHLATESGYNMTNVTMIGANTTFLNGTIKPTSVTNALFNEAANGIQLSASVAISNVFGIRTNQPITKSNQGIIGDSTEITLHSTGQKVICTGGLNPQGFFQASIASPTLNWNSANFNMSAVTSFQMVYNLIGNATPTAITLPSVTSTMVGQQFIFKKRGGLGACAYTITTTGGQPVFPIGGSLGTLTFPYTILTASTQSSTQLMCVQSHFAGTGGTGQVTTAGTPTLTINTWNGLPSTMITIGTSITIAGITKKVSSFGTGVGGTGNYQMDSNYVGALANQAITSTDQFGYDILWVN